MLVDEVRVFLECLEALLPHRLLQLADGQWIEQVIFAIDALMIISADCQLRFGLRQRAEGMLMFQLCLASEDVETDSLQSRSRAGEVGID